MQRKVTILSDNISVLHIHKLQFASPRERRLAVYLSQYNLNVKFIRGVHNLAADALSRAFENMTEEEKEIFKPQITMEDFIFQCSEGPDDSVNVVRKRKAGDDPRATSVPLQKDTVGDPSLPINDCDLGPTASSALTANDLMSDV